MKTSPEFNQWYNEDNGHGIGFKYEKLLGWNGAVSHFENKIKELEQKLTESEKKIQEKISINQSEALLNTSLSRENKKLEQKLSEALEVIRFYGDMKSTGKWTRVLEGHHTCITQDDWEASAGHWIGGKRAREFLKKHES